MTTRKYEHLVKPLSVASLNMNMDEAKHFYTVAKDSAQLYVVD